MEVEETVSMVLARKGTALWSINPEATVYEAIKMMADKNVGALPVMTGKNLVGMISERDYTRKVILKGRASKDTLVAEIMTRDPVTARPNDRVVDCMRKMTEHRVRHLPVREGNELVGILSIGDLVNFVISAQTVAIDHLERYIFGQT